MSEPQDDLQAKLAQLIAQAEEVRRQIEQGGPPTPEQRRAAFRVIKGALAGIAALAPVAFVRSHLGATGVLAAASVGLMLTPSLAPPPTPEPPPAIALPPGPPGQPPPLEPRPEPPMEPDGPEDTTPDIGQPEPPAAPLSPEGTTDSEPDTAPDSPPPPEDEPAPPEEPKPEQPDCSIIELDVDVATACLLPT